MHQLITTFHNEVGVLSAAYALTEVDKYDDDWSLRKLKAKRSEKLNSRSVRKNFLYNFDLSSSRDNDVTQNVSSAREA